MKYIVIESVKNIDHKRAKARINYAYHDLTQDMQTVLVIEHLIFDIIIHGTYYEVATLEKGQRCDRDVLLIISKAQRLMDDYQEQPKSNS